MAGSLHAPSTVDNLSEGTAVVAASTAAMGELCHPKPPSLQEKKRQSPLDCGAETIQNGSHLGSESRESGSRCRGNVAKRLHAKA